MRIRAFTGAVLLGVLLACAATAAENPKVALDAQDMPIAEAVAALSKQAGVQIVCDADVKGTVIGNFQSIELEKLLDTITKVNGLKWQKVYLPAKAEEKPTIEQVKARAEAVAALVGGSIIVTDPVTGKQRVFVEQDPAAPSVTPDKLGLAPVYLVSKPKTETKTDTKKPDTDATKRFQALEDERLKLLAQMGPEQRRWAMQQEMVYMMNMAPATRQQMMIDQMMARHNMDPQLQQQYREAMHQTFHTMREQGLIPEGMGRGGPGRDRGPRGE